MAVSRSSDMSCIHPACLSCPGRDFYCIAENGVSVPGESSESMGQALDDSFRVAYLQVGSCTHDAAPAVRSGNCLTQSWFCLPCHACHAMSALPESARVCAMTSGQEASCTAGLEHACCLSLDSPRAACAHVLSGPT